MRFSLLLPKLLEEKEEQSVMSIPEIKGNPAVLALDETG